MKNDGKLNVGLKILKCKRVERCRKLLKKCIERPLKVSEVKMRFLGKKLKTRSSRKIVLARRTGIRVFGASTKKMF